MIGFNIPTNPTVVIGALSIAVNVILAMVVYINNRKSATNIIFGLLNVALAFYLVANILGTILPRYEQKLLWVRLVMFSAVFIDTFFFLFIKAFPERKIRLNWHQKILVIVITGIAAILTLTKYVFSGLILHGETGVPSPIVAPGIAFFGLSVLVFLGSGIYLLIKKYRQATDVIKEQLKYLLIGTAVMFCLLVLLNFVAVVALETTFFINFTPLYISIFIIFAAYAILKHHLFNVKIIATELLTFALWLTLLIRLVTAATLGDRILNGFIFIATVVLGIFLIRSVLKEVKTRERMQQLALDLEITNKELKQLDEAKSDFISIASHQLRTPLSIIKGYISMIREGTYGKIEEKLNDPIHKVYVSNERLINLVSDLLDLSRMERGKMQYEFLPIRLGEVAEGIVQDFEKVAKDKGLEFSWKKSATNDLVKGDAGKLRQVVLNLIDNAIKYTSAGSIATEIQNISGNRLRFSVTDTGPGLTAEEAHALFQKFSRGHEESKSHTEGLGLGLYVAKLIAQAHGGELAVTSPGKDKGSMFSLTLPVYSETTEEFKKFASEI